VAGVYGVCVCTGGETRNGKICEALFDFAPTSVCGYKIHCLIGWGDEEGVIASPRLGMCVRVFVQYPVKCSQLDLPLYLCR